MERPRIAVTLGDPCGVGPEITWNAFNQVYEKLDYDLEILGDIRIYDSLGISVSDEFRSCFTSSFNENSLSKIQSVGKECERGGEHAYTYLMASVSSVLNGSVRGLINGPLSKSSVAKVSPGFLGHTQFYEEHLLAADSTEAMMCFWGNRFSLLLLSHHVPLAQVSEMLLSRDQGAIVLKCMKSFQDLLGELRIGVCGFNPHAGEQGLMDHGEDRHLGRLVRDLKISGYNVQGPLPADTLFCPGILDAFNMIVSSHHDQGLVPFKMAHFPGGVGFTLGLSVPRFTVDHGTAFDLAGTGKASCHSMKDAFLLMNRALKLDQRGELVQIAEQM